jgi:hypothetical protein
MGLTAKDIELFWAKVDRNGPVVRPHLGPCWIWKGGIATHCGGYGVFPRNRKGLRKVFRAHRVSYVLEKGPIPDGKLLRHRCDVPACVRPSHLLPGTEKQNAQDMVRRGRHWTKVRPERIPRGEQHWSRRLGTERLPRGERHHAAVLTDEKRARVFELYASGKTEREIGDLLGVSKSCVAQVRWRARKKGDL